MEHPWANFIKYLVLFKKNEIKVVIFSSMSIRAVKKVTQEVAEWQEGLKTRLTPQGVEN